MKNLKAVCRDFAKDTIFVFKGDTIDIPDAGGQIVVEPDGVAAFHCGNTTKTIPTNHPDLRKWLSAYVYDGPEEFMKVAEQTEWERLKSALFEEGYDALSDFIGYDFNAEEDKDTIENRLEESYQQMPLEDFAGYYRQYVLGLAY